MSQSNVIAGFLTLAFLVFITMKGELPIYLGFLLSDPKGGGGGGGSLPQANTNAKTLSDNQQKFAGDAIGTAAKIYFGL